jgi:hypothetical protein
MFWIVTYVNQDGGKAVQLLSPYKMICPGELSQQPIHIRPFPDPTSGIAEVKRLVAEGYIEEVE